MGCKVEKGYGVAVNFKGGMRGGMVKILWQKGDITVFVRGKRKRVILTPAKLDAQNNPFLWVF